MAEVADRPATVPTPAAQPHLRPVNGCWLGFDYGAARIGVAVATFPVAVATPLTTLAAQPTERCWQAIDQLVAEWQPHGFVVGSPPEPASADATGTNPHPLAAVIGQFAETLARRHRRPVYLIDESLTSVHAERLLVEAGLRRWQNRKARLDATAAALILQAFCDGQPPLARVEPTP